MSKKKENEITLPEKLGNLHERGNFRLDTSFYLSTMKKQHRCTGRGTLLITFHSLHWWRKDSCLITIGMAEHTSPNTGQLRSTAVSHLYSQPGGGHCITQGRMGVALKKRMSKRGLGEAGFIVSRRQDTPWLLWDDISLNCWDNPIAIREVKPTTQG